MRLFSFLFAVPCLLTLASCGGATTSNGGGSSAGGGPESSGVGAADRTVTRVPASHRLASSACSQEERGAGVSSIGPACSSVACTRDSDCTSGANGRCLQVLGGPACQYYCSYDECTDDSDCTGNAPCACRSSSSDATPNTCATESNCRTDADCGPGGFCSPSLVSTYCQCITVTRSFGNCGHGYFCHTPKDSCLDDGDCASGKCNFDLTSHSWICTLAILHC